MNLQNIVENIEVYVTDLIFERRNGFYDKIAMVFLFVLSRIFRSIVQLRITLYQQRIFRDHRLGCLVVSIGNLTAGGTGKTPVVEVFSRILTEKGRRVAILSRGYKSKSKPLKEAIPDFFFRRGINVTPPRVVSDGTRLLLDSEMAGDEPYMLASNLKDVIVLVDKDRVKSGRYAISHYNTDTLILDDGFQHLPLRPRLNILLVDSTNPFGNHHILPRGLLREPIKNIRRADYILLTKSNGGSHIRHLRKFISKHNHHAEIIECTHRAQYLQDVYSKEQFPLDTMTDKKLASICGIAAPESFEGYINSVSEELVYSERFADHHRYTQQEVIDCINRSQGRGAEMLITTEKDAVRFPMVDRRDIPIYFLRVEIDILSGSESFDQCISRLCFSQLPS